jgi:hypothetical protein
MRHLFPYGGSSLSYGVCSCERDKRPCHKGRTETVCPSSNAVKSFDISHNINNRVQGFI